MADYYIEWLQNRGFDISDLESRAFNGNTPLLLAALHGELTVVERLLEAGADLYAVNDDFNGVLFNACYADNPQIIKVLIDAGADVNDINEEGTTPLMYAASAGRADCVAMLLELGGDASMTNEDGFKAVEYAANREVLKLLRHA
ncbi:MAG: ankyrin repeat domain-containing protein [Sulfurimonadaceae bacterium]|nr:ankyrin repeat domain-containing protein [Sulfurimonadaceae bacterium]